MLPASILGTTNTSAAPATGESMCLIRAAVASTAASRSSGPSTMPPTICWRLDIFARIAPSSVAGMRVRKYRLDRRQNCHLGDVDPKCAGKADGILADVAFLVGIRGDVQRYVGDDQATRIGRH